MDSIDFATQDSFEGDHDFDSVVGDFRRDVLSLLRGVSLDKLRQIGEEHLFRDGFQAESCTSVETAENHLMRIYELAGRRRGKIRRIVCLAISSRFKDRENPYGSW